MKMLLTSTVLAAALAVAGSNAFAEEKMINSILEQDTPMRIVLIMYQETYPSGTIKDFRADNPEHANVQMHEWLEKNDTFLSPVGRYKTANSG